MTAGQHVENFEHALHASPQQWDVTHGFIIGFCRVQAEEAGLADHLAFVAKMFDANIVTGHAPVDAALQCRLGHDQRFRFSQERPDLFCQEKWLRSAIQDVAGIVLKQAKIGAFNGIGFFRQDIAVWAGLERVAARAKEDEPFFAKPFEKGHRLVLIAWRDMFAGIQAFNLGRHARAHVLIVVRRSVDIGLRLLGFGEEQALLAFAQVGKMNLDQGEATVRRLNDRVEQGQDLKAEIAASTEE